eukprot:TRINITY_DN47605_c0_g1_i1.p1 TRINITY_DN47605_c0_g1~~TRINITY_DN47605_c0_g1_i1.p1  ORF type:complete len:644 (+),score=176.34 TRINITY_DN47605_c0_g1_i1:46-1932(+)
MDHPLYKDALKEAVAREFVTKADLDAAVDRAIRSSGPKLAVLDGSHGLLWCPGGGSQMRRRIIPCGADERRAEREAAISMAREIDFLTPSNICINLLSGAASPLYRDVAMLLQELRCGVVPCTSVGEDYLVRTAERFRANTVVATASRLTRLAWHLGREGRRLPLRDIVLCGEGVTSKQREWFSDAFGAFEHGKFFPPRFASLFGSNELGILGLSPFSLHNPLLMLFDDRVWTMRTAPVPEGGLPGKVEYKRWAEVWENERKMAVAGWRSTTVGGKAPARGDPVHWTTQSLEPLRKEEAKLPGPEEGEWTFSGEWTPDADWLYGSDWSEAAAGQWLPDAKKGQFRRRRWRIEMRRTKAPEEAPGVGMLVLTSQLRKRLPLLHYSLGDVGVLREVKCAGRMWKAFQLCGVRHRSFKMRSATVWASEFDALLHDFPDWQVEHSMREEEQGFVDCVRLRVVTEPASNGDARELGAETRKTLGMTIRSALAKAPKRSLPEFHLDIVESSPDALITDEVTGKRWQVADLYSQPAPASPGSPFGARSGGMSDGMSSVAGSPSPRRHGYGMSSCPSESFSPSIAPSRQGSFTSDTTSIYPGGGFMAAPGRATAGYHLSAAGSTPPGSSVCSGRTS